MLQAISNAPLPSCDVAIAWHARVTQQACESGANLLKPLAWLSNSRKLSLAPLYMSCTCHPSTQQQSLLRQTVASGLCMLTLQSSTDMLHTRRPAGHAAQEKRCCCMGLPCCRAGYRTPTERRSPSLRSADLQRLGSLYAAHRLRIPHIFWRETSPQHFMTPEGLYLNNIGLGQPPFTCAPIPGVSLQADHSLVADWPEQVRAQCCALSTECLREEGTRWRPSDWADCMRPRHQGFRPR